MKNDNSQLLFDFGSRLESLMVKRDITNDYLAKKFEVSRQTVYNWTSGRAAPPFETLVKLSRALNTSLDFLMRGIHSTGIKYSLLPFSVLNVYSSVDIESDNVHLRGRNPRDRYIYPAELPSGNFLYIVPRDNMQSPDPSKSINKGDLVLIDPYRKSLHGDIVVVLFDDYSSNVYQYFREEHDAILRSFDDHYPPFRLGACQLRAIATAIEVIPRSRKLV